MSLHKKTMSRLTLTLMLSCVITGCSILSNMIEIIRINPDVRECPYEPKGLYVKLCAKSQGLYEICDPDKNVPVAYYGMTQDNLKRQLHWSVDIKRTAGCYNERSNETRH